MPRSMPMIFRTLIYAAATVLGMHGAFALAQQTEVTEEQLEILRSLPAEQREALIEQILESRGTGEGRATERGVTPETGVPRVREVRPLSTEERVEREKRQLRERLLRLEEETVPTLRGGDTIIIELTPREAPPLSTLGEDRVRELRERILQRNPYRLDRAGQLLLPGFEPLALVGLTAEMAAKRLAADKDLAAYTIAVTRLELEPVGDEALEPFGYHLFTDAPSTFVPATDIPVPPDYVVGPGDQLRIQLFGNTNRALNLTVGRNGEVSLPQLGPIAVGGQRFSAVKQNIESRVERQMIGVRANVEMGQTRAIRVFLLGEVEKPGSYTVSGLSTITNALFTSGGIRRVGSLRDIQLKRNGELVRTLDLYDLLLKGDTSNDARLLSGDVVFIPPIGPTVSVNGEVLRPAIYEMRGNTTIGELLDLVGGLTPKADPHEARLERLNGRGEREVTNLDLASEQTRSMPLENGDSLRVLRIRDTLEGGVTVAGHVYNAQSFEYRPGLRVSDVLSFEALKPRADTHYILIRRELPPDRRVSVLSADLAAAVAAPGSDEDILLAARDQLMVFDIDSNRERRVGTVLTEIRAQATYDQPLQVVGIGGRVRAPGPYPLEPQMRISDLLRAGGSLDDAAYGGEAELARYEVINGEYRQTALLDIDLAAVLRGDPTADLLVQPYDALNIKELPQWREQEAVTIDGEVRFPGTYRIQRGETLRMVLQRAGGLSDLAFAEGAIFTREELRKREQRQLDLLSERLRRDLAILAVQAAQTGGAGVQTLSIGEGLLAQLESTEAVGRLVIDLERLISGAAGGAQDILLRDGDRLLVPKQNQEVSVIGEVLNATSHRYAQELSSDDYIGLSGGYTNQADKGKVYIVRADGSVVPETGGWFSRASDEVRPGDTVVVPVDAGKIRPLPLWAAVTSIIYNLAVAVAAINSF